MKWMRMFMFEHLIFRSIKSRIYTLMKLNHTHDVSSINLKTSKKLLCSNHLIRFKTNSCSYRWPNALQIHLFHACYVWHTAQIHMHTRCKNGMKFCFGRIKILPTRWRLISFGLQPFSFVKIIVIKFHHLHKMFIEKKPHRFRSSASRVFRLFRSLLSSDSDC